MIFRRSGTNGGRARLLSGLVLLGLLAICQTGAPMGPQPARGASAVERPRVGGFLVARARLPDPNFFEAVVLLLKVEQSGGTLGVVVNRRGPMRVADAVRSDSPLVGRDDPLYLGGPVSRGTLSVLVRAAETPPDAVRIFADVHLLQEGTGLESVIDGDPQPSAVRFYAGYAGWAPGQLEGEIERGVWNLLPGDPRWIFDDDPAGTWERLTRIALGPTT